LRAKRQNERQNTGGNMTQENQPVKFKLLKPALSSFGARFWSKVNQLNEGDCWEWLGTKRGGYGLFKLNKRHQQATRVAYQLTHGPLLSHLELDHLCKNKGCVNPAHLEPVSHRENVLRAEGPTSINAKKTHCISGHPLDGFNLYRSPNTGSRQCRTCTNISRKKYKLNHKKGTIQ
jgi:hypothetical protein